MSRSTSGRYSRISAFVILLSVIVLAVWWGIVSFERSRAETAHQPSSLAARTLQDSLATAAVITPQGAYLDVKELGVKMLLDTSISDAVYSPFEIKPTDGSQVFGVSAQSLIDQGTGNVCSASSGALGLIIATTNPSVITGAHTSAQLVPDNQTVFKFGNVYVRYIPPQNAGCAVGQVTAATVWSKQSSFAKAFASLQPDN